MPLVDPSDPRMNQTTAESTAYRPWLRCFATKFSTLASYKIVHNAENGGMAKTTGKTNAVRTAKTDGKYVSETSRGEMRLEVKTRKK